MIRARVFWCEEQEDEIDGLIVQCFKIHWSFKARKNSCNLVDACQLTVRNGNTVANPGRTEALTLENCFENFTLRETGQFRGFFRQNLQKLLFGAGFQRRDNRPWLNQITKIHSLRSFFNQAIVGPV